MGPNKEKSNTCYGVGEVGAGLWWALRFLKFIIFEINSRLSLVFCTNWFLAKVYYSDTYFWDDGKVAVCTIFPGRCYADIFNKGLNFFTRENLLHVRFSLGGFFVLCCIVDFVFLVGPDHRLGLGGFRWQLYTLHKAHEFF